MSSLSLFIVCFSLVMTASAIVFAFLGHMTSKGVDFNQYQDEEYFYSVSRSLFICLMVVLFCYLLLIYIYPYVNAYIQDIP